MWFTSTVEGEAVFVHDYIGRITPTGSMKLFRIPILGSEPKQITVASDGTVWFAERGGVSGLVVKPDGEVWFEDIGDVGGHIGRLSLRG